MTRHLGLDLGGTNIKVALLERAAGAEPRLVHEDELPTEADGGPEHVVGRLVEAGRRVGRVDTAGVTVPGLYDRARGTVRFLPNLPGNWNGHPVVAPVREALGVPADMINDARAFGLAEFTLGAAQGVRDALFVVLGTGVGGAVVVDAHLHEGLDGAAGEIGHTTIVPDGPVCGCGNRGCVEALASADEIAAMGRRSSVREVADAARAGDGRARGALEQAGTYIGIALSNAIVALTPERVVIGGGIARAGDLLFEPIRAEVRRRVRVAPVDRIEIVPAELGPIAGAVGAALRGAGF